MNTLIVLGIVYYLLTKNKTASANTYKSTAMSNELTDSIPVLKTDVNILKDKVPLFQDKSTIVDNINQLANNKEPIAVLIYNLFYKSTNRLVLRADMATKLTRALATFILPNILPDLYSLIKKYSLKMIQETLNDNDIFELYGYLNKNQVTIYKALNNFPMAIMPSKDTMSVLYKDLGLINNQNATTTLTPTTYIGITPGF